MNILFTKQRRFVLTLLTVLIILIFHVPSFRELGAFPDFEWIINNGPVFTAGDDPTRTVAENTPSGTNIGTPVAATDADGDTLTYTLSGTDADSFRIISATGQLRTKAALDYETKAAYTVTITVSDGNGGSDSITLTVNVTDANDAPTFTEGINTTRTVAENTTTGQNIGTPISATDADGDTLTYTLSGNPDASAFRIVSTSGQLQTKAALDYETKSSYTVTVSVSDGKGGTDRITATINVTDVSDNSAPVFTEGNSATRSVAENTPPGRNIGSPIAATDTDNDTLTYSLSGIDAAAFSIVATTGQLRTRAPLNYENKPSYTVTVSVSDGKGGSESITVTITVTDVNERPPRTPNRAPVFTEGTTTTRTVPETAPINANIGASITATDADNDTLTYTLNGNTDAASFRIDSTTGQLRTSAALDYETKSAYTVNVSVSDGKGGSDTITVTVSVKDVAELPDGMTPIRQRTPQVRDAIVAAAGVNSPDDVTAAHLAAITHLSLQRRGITALKSGDFDGLTALKELRIHDNSIRDISPLAGLTTLTILYMYGNGASDISPLAGLTNLTELTLDSNSIRDISPLAGLTKLTILHLHRNSISDISPLAGLTKLTTLKLNYNSIRDISPLENMTNLTWLMLQGNSISDISVLENMTKLKQITLHENSISDISPLEGLTSLEWLSLDGNSISDISPLEGLANLTDLMLHNNSISDISVLENMTNLTWLELRGNSISDISPLEGLTSLEWLKLQRNFISDISPLEGLTSLKWLELHRNPISDYGPLQRFKAANPDVHIDINLNNNPPRFTAGDSTTRTVVENTATGTDIGTPVTATDADNDTLTYFLSGTDAESFRIVKTSGQLQTKVALDYETKTSYTVTVTAYDGNSGGDRITVTINVTDVVNENVPAAPSVETPPVLPKNTALLTNFPNPFNPETWIPYHLAEDANVTVTIYDVRGSVVRTLTVGHQPAGVYQSRGRAAYWDGKNQSGEPVASGLYFYTLTAGEFNATRKMLITK